MKKITLVLLTVLTLVTLSGCVSGHYQGAKADGTPVNFDGVIVFSPSTLKK